MRLHSRPGTKGSSVSYMYIKCDGPLHPGMTATGIGRQYFAIEFGEKMQSKSYYAVQGHSRSISQSPIRKFGWDFPMRTVRTRLLPKLRRFEILSSGSTNSCSDQQTIDTKM